MPTPNHIHVFSDGTEVSEDSPLGNDLHDHLAPDSNWGSLARYGPEHIHFHLGNATSKPLPIPKHLAAVLAEQEE